MFVIFSLFSWLPYVVLIVITWIFGLDAVPHEANVTTFVIFLFKNVSNPMIQIYFRKDLLDALKKTFCSISMWAKARAYLSPPSSVTLKSTHGVQHMDVTVKTQ